MLSIWTSLKICRLVQSYGQGYRNRYPFAEGENIVLGEMDLFLKDWNCA